jgi:hypothetical protein
LPLHSPGHQRTRCATPPVTLGLFGTGSVDFRSSEALFGLCDLANRGTLVTGRPSSGNQLANAAAREGQVVRCRLIANGGVPSVLQLRRRQRRPSRATRRC